MDEQVSSKGAVEVLAALNRLSLKAFSCKSKKTLLFTILNETIHVIPYSRAIIWSIDKKEPYFEGISGGGNLGKPEKNLLGQLLSELESPSTVQKISKETFKSSKEKELFEDKIGKKTSVLYLPLLSSGNAKYALWLEREGKDQWREDQIDLLCFLAQGYALALERFYRPPFLQKLKTPLGLTLLFIILFSLIGIRVPLRVVAPCEVVAKNPYYVTAPLKGIIDEIAVDPGTYVSSGDLLFSYDSQVAIEELNIAEKEVERAASELQRTMSFAFRDPMQLAKMGLLALELEKQQLVLSQANERFSKLHVEAEREGVVILDDPEVWRGQPVTTGERILMISDPVQTKLRMWIPESDNVSIDQSKAIKIFLNVDPASTYQAQIGYIGNDARISEAGFNSFHAEGEWVTPPEDVKLGLKGTAVLYGENVSLGYFLIRRPLQTIRNFFAI